MKRILSLLLSFALVFGLTPLAVSATEPLVPRSFALDMRASLGTYKGTEYIVLDIEVVDITDPYGIISIEFNIEFDGDKLVPLWQTDVELNGDALGNVDGVNIPQMVVAWPTMEKTTYIPGEGVYTYDIFAAMGLCTEYSITGNGVLNVDLLMLDGTDAVAKEDGEIALRLYFTPVDGFDNGATYTFVVDGQYDVPSYNSADITLAATSGIINVGNFQDHLELLRIFGYGAEASVTVREAESETSEPEEDYDSSFTESEESNLEFSSEEEPSEQESELSEVSEEISESEETTEEESSDPSFHRPSIDGKGDANGDGLTDNLDAAFILRHDARIISFTEEQLENCDVNGDGTVNNLDAALVLKYDVGLIQNFF